MMSLNHNNIAILNIKGSDCPCIISLMSKSEAIDLLQNANLTEKKENIIKKVENYQLKKYKSFWKYI